MTFRAFLETFEFHSRNHYCSVVMCSPVGGEIPHSQRFVFVAGIRNRCSLSAKAVTDCTSLLRFLLPRRVVTSRLVETCSVEPTIVLLLHFALFSACEPVAVVSSTD